MIPALTNRDRSMADDARAGHGGTAMADDVLREAFARLSSPQDLLRCAATCRRWRRLVLDDGAFLRARRPSFLAGIFFQNTSRWRPKKKGESFYMPPQFLKVQAGAGVTFNSFFASDDDDALFDCARPLAARLGFLLMSVLPPRDDDECHLAVCRPPVSTHLLPPPPFPHKTIIGYAILAGGEAGNNLDNRQQQQQPPFQVLLIYYNSQRLVCASTYSSGTGSWNAPIECRQSSGFRMCGPRAGVVTHVGTVHWLFKDRRRTNLVYYTLNINVATSHVSLTQIPIKVDAHPPIPCIAGEEGWLSFVVIGEHGVAHLWTLQDQQHEDDQHARGVWQCSELADLGSHRIDLVFFAESRGALLVRQHGVGFSIVDLETKEKTPMHLNKKEGRGYKKTINQFMDSCSSTCCRGHPHGMCEDTSPILYEMDLFFSRAQLTSSQLGR